MGWILSNEQYRLRSTKYKDFPILSKLLEARVFGIGQTDTGFCIGEECDCYFGMDMTKDEVLALAEELRRFVDDQ